MMATRKLFTLLMTICLFAVSGSALAGSRGDNDKNDAGDRSQGYKDTRKIDVMTANLYLGADIFRIVEAAADTSDPYAIPTAVTQVFGIVQATNFPERAEAIADSIMKRRPQVIGLQEVSWYRTGPYDGGVDATYTVYDFLEILMNALAARGLDYRVAGEVTNADVEAPMFVSAEGDLADLRLTDRDVILVRGDVDAITGFTFTSLLNIEARGVKAEDVVVMQYPDFGVKLYGNAIIATPKILRENPEAVKAFLRAFTKGAKDVIASPAKGIESVKARDGIINTELEVRRLKLAIDTVINSPDARKEGFGQIQGPRMALMASQVSDAFNTKSRVNPDAIWNGSFLPSAKDLDILPKK